MKRQIATGLGLAAVLLFTAGRASASTITFNFEELGLTSGQGSVSSTQGGLTLSVHRADNANDIGVTDTNSLVPFGDRTLLPSTSGSWGAGAALVFSFSQAVSNISISFGDFNADDDGLVTLLGFAGLNGTGANLGSVSVSYPQNLDIGVNAGDFRTLILNVSGLQSFTILGGGAFPNSLFFDNVVANTDSVPVPEPTSILLLASGGLGWLARRRAVKH